MDETGFEYNIMLFHLHKTVSGNVTVHWVTMPVLPQTHRTVSVYRVLQMRGGGYADVLPVLQVPDNKADAVPCERLPGNK